MPSEPVANSILTTADALAAVGAHLVEAGVIDQRSLERVRRVAAEAGTRLDRILTQLGLVSERSLAEVLARMLAVPLLRSTDSRRTAVCRAAEGEIPAHGPGDAGQRRCTLGHLGDGRPARRIHP